MRRRPVIPTWLRRLAAMLRSSGFLACGVAAMLVLLVPVAAGGGLRSPQLTKLSVQARPAIRVQPVENVLFVGASLTSGAAQTTLGNSFPEMVVTGLRSRGLPVDWTERAKWGAVVSDALDWPYPSGQQVIIVHLVTNDFVHETPVETYRADLQQLLVELRGRSPQAQIVCLGTWEKPGALNRARVSDLTYDTAAQGTCSGEGGRFVPLDQIFAAPGSRGPAGRPTPFGPSDDYHPNNVGAQRIADAVLAAIPPTVPQSPYPHTPGRS